MMKFPMKYLLFLFAVLSYGQDVTGVANAVLLARTTSTTAFTITASQGDGTTCTVVKVSGKGINGSLTCSNGSNKLGPMPLISNGSAAISFQWGMGDVSCLVVVNPTTAAVTMGSVGPAPVNGAAGSCTTNIAAGGQTPIVTFSVSWP